MIVKSWEERPPSPTCEHRIIHVAESPLKRPPYRIAGCLGCGTMTRWPQTWHWNMEQMIFDKDLGIDVVVLR